MTKYDGYKWIKVKRANPVEINGVKYVTEQHHVEEVTFLIDEVRKLAGELAKYEDKQAE